MGETEDTIVASTAMGNNISTFNLHDATRVHKYLPLEKSSPVTNDYGGDDDDDDDNGSCCSNHNFDGAKPPAFVVVVNVVRVVKRNI